MIKENIWYCGVNNCHYLPLIAITYHTCRVLLFVVGRSDVTSLSFKKEGTSNRSLIKVELKKLLYKAQVIFTLWSRFWLYMLTFLFTRCCFFTRPCNWTRGCGRWKFCKIRHVTMICFMAKHKYLHAWVLLREVDHNQGTFVLLIWINSWENCFLSVSQYPLMANAFQRKAWQVQQSQDQHKKCKSGFHWLQGRIKRPELGHIKWQMCELGR